MKQDSRALYMGLYYPKESGRFGVSAIILSSSRFRGLVAFLLRIQDIIGCNLCVLRERACLFGTERQRMCLQEPSYVWGINHCIETMVWTRMPLQGLEKALYPRLCTSTPCSVHVPQALSISRNIQWNTANALKVIIDRDIFKKNVITDK